MGKGFGRERRFCHFLFVGWVNKKSDGQGGEGEAVMVALVLVVVFFRFIVFVCVPLARKAHFCERKLSISGFKEADLLMRPRLRCV